MKKAVLMITLIALFIMSSCSAPRLIWDKDKKIISDKAEECVKALMQQDTEKLVDMFCPYIVENEKEKTVKQAEQALQFFDGKIVSYEADFGIAGETSRSRGGEGLVYYSCASDFTVKTDTKKEYRVSVGNHYIWDKHPEYEGIGGLTISEKGGERRVRICDYDFPTNDT